MPSFPAISPLAAQPPVWLATDIHCLTAMFPNGNCHLSDFPMVAISSCAYGPNHMAHPHLSAQAAVIVVAIGNIYL